MSSARNEFRDLEPIERRACMMRASGMSDAVIARFLDIDSGLVGQIFKRPRVARFLIALEGTFINDISKSAKILDTAIMHEATRAFQIEKQVMERLFEKEDSIRAQLGAAATAQDILDRAGKRAPTKILAEVMHTIDAEALELVADVLAEAKAIDVTKESKNGSAKESAKGGPNGMAREEGADQGPETVHRDGPEPGDESSQEDQTGEVRKTG
jgi:hypothetical protein